MFFWGKKKVPSGGDPSTKIPEPQLQKFIEDLFDSSNTEFINKTEKLSGEMDKNKDELQKAINEFAMSTAKPKMDYEFHEKVVAMQKGNYAGMLKSAVQVEILETSTNSYESVKLKAENAERMINEIGSANFKFKNVLYGYAAHLVKIKKGFSELQLHTEELKKLMEGTRSSYERHLEALSQAGELIAISKKIEVLTDSISDYGQHDKAEDSAHIAELKDAIEKEKAVVSRIDSEISATNIKITGYLLPLARAARKYDHIVKSKKGLSELISNPVAEINTKNEFVRFEAMLDSMSKMIDEKSIDNTGDIKNKIKSIKGANLMPLIEEARNMEVSRLSAEHRLREVAVSHSVAVEKARNIAEARANEGLTKQSLADLEIEKNAIKSKVCELVREIYGKKISIE